MYLILTNRANEKKRVCAKRKNKRWFTRYFFTQDWQHCSQKVNPQPDWLHKEEPLWRNRQLLGGSTTCSRLMESERFITVFVRTRYSSISWARWIQSEPSHLTSLRSISILSSHLPLRLPHLWPSPFPPTRTHFVSPMPATYPAHHSPLAKRVGHSTNKFQNFFFH